MSRASIVSSLAGPSCSSSSSRPWMGDAVSETIRSSTLPSPMLPIFSAVWTPAKSRTRKYVLPYVADVVQSLESTYVSTHTCSAGSVQVPLKTFYTLELKNSPRYYRNPLRLNSGAGGCVGSVTGHFVVRGRPAGRKLASTIHHHWRCVGNRSGCYNAWLAYLKGTILSTNQFRRRRRLGRF
jgi:hypothetical protein